MIFRGKRRGERREERGERIAMRATMPHETTRRSAPCSPHSGVKGNLTTTYAQ
jgi:hypothetical protein